MFVSFRNKLGQLLLSLWILSVVVFLISRAAPGDPLRSFYGESVERMSAAQLNDARERLGLNENLFTQYVSWIKHVFHGDFGISFRYKQPAIEVIGEFIGNTAIFVFASFILIFILSILLALYCAKREGSIADRLIRRSGIILNSIPEFFIGIILIYLFCVIFNVLPPSGVYAIGGDSLISRIVHLILPVSAIVLTHTWYCAYLMRNKLSEELTKEYVMLLKAKGLSQDRIINKHCLRNSLPAIISMMTVFLPHLIAGAYIIEVIFSYPGMGMLAFESALYHDYNMLMLICLITGGFFILTSMTAQQVSEKIDPRMKRHGGYGNE